MHWLFPDFRFQWLVDEIRRNLPKELNFQKEASNQERFSKLFLHLDYVKAPKVHWELTTSRVLTMEYCEGSKVNDLNYIRRQGIDVDDVSDLEERENVCNGHLINFASDIVEAWSDVQ